MNKTLKTIIFSTLLLGMGSLKAQDDWTLTWHGFVNPHFFADSRQVVGGREDMMMFYPKPIVLDAEGNDINDYPSMNMLNITARVNLTIKGPDVLGAKLKGFIEGDFTGSTNATINSLRLRHAYLDMRWTNRELLMGQYWHPMTNPELIPGTCPLNMGSPFSTYARYNQLRFIQYLGKWELAAAAAFQLDNTSQGPIGPSSTYVRNSMVPELNLQWRYRGEHLFAGIAANLLTIKPRPEVSNFSSASFNAFLRYQNHGWTLRAQSLFNNNLYEIASVGGYIETFTATGYEYRPWHFNTIWADVARTSGNWCPGIFLGYAKNSTDGTLQANEVQYGRGFDIESLFRIQPRLSYYAGHGLTFTAEVEYTHVNYETPVGATRWMIDAIYTF